jgi:ribosomal protein S18 acetylase RimI-like enzyme
MSDAPGSLVTVTKTYLEMTREQFTPTLLDDPDLLVLQSREPLPDFYRFLYTTVGRDYEWIDRLGWSDEQLREHLANPAITLLVLYVRGTPAGYAELNTDANEPGTDLTYFGLFPAFHGRGLGKHFLSAAVQRAFEDGAARVWLNTNTLDGQHALANYRARGFVPYKTEQYQHRLSGAADGVPDTV